MIIIISIDIISQQNENFQVEINLPTFNGSPSPSLTTSTVLCHRQGVHQEVLIRIQDNQSLHH